MFGGAVGDLSPAPGVALDGRHGRLEPGQAPIRRERDQLVVDSGSRGGEAADVGGLAGVGIGALDRLPDFGQEIRIERGGPERVLQALRALVEQQPGRAGAAGLGQGFKKLNGLWNAAVFVLQDHCRAIADQFGQGAARELPTNLAKALGKRHRRPLFTQIGKVVGDTPSYWREYFTF